MNKLAYLEGYLTKRASFASDLTGSLTSRLAGSLVTDPISKGGLVLADGMGSLTGALSDHVPDDKEMEEKDENWKRAFIPGVGSHRLQQAASRTTGKGASSINRFSEFLSPASSILFATILGASTGAYITKFNGGGSGGEYTRNALDGAKVGMGISIAANGIGWLKGLLEKKTSRKQLAENDKSNNVLSNLLIPGVGINRDLKRIRAGYEKDPK